MNKSSTPTEKTKEPIDPPRFAELMAKPIDPSWAGVYAVIDRIISRRAEAAAKAA